MAAVWLACAAGQVGRLAWFLPAWLALGAGAAIWAWRRCAFGPLLAGWSWHRTLLCGVLLAIAVSRLWGALLHAYPKGWDPTFHLILARKISESNRMIGDWEPFENIPLHYPVGSHFLLVVLSRLSGVPLHVAFGLLLQALGPVSALVVYGFARVSMRDRVLALYATLIYGGWAIHGSLDYYLWGGLPNELGMALFLLALTLVAAGPGVPARRTVLGLVLAALVLAHHHVAITAAVVFACLVVTFWLRGERHRAVDLVLAGLLCAGLASFYVLPYLGKGATIGQTSVFRCDERFYDWEFLTGTLGRPLVSATLVGIGGMFVLRRSRLPGPTFWVASLCLATLFVTCMYAYRPFARRFLGGDYVAFTPSRFLTDLVYLLTLVAALPFAWVDRRLKRKPLAPLLRAVPFAFALWQCTAARGLWECVPRSDTDPDELRCYEWIDRNLPKETFVMQPGWWAPYAAWRIAEKTPIPVSEPTIAGTRNEAWRDELRAGRRPPELAAWKIVFVSNDPKPSYEHQVLHEEKNGMQVREWKLK